MRKQIIRMIGHIMDGYFIGAAITCMTVLEYRAAFILGAIGILGIMADAIVMIKEHIRGEN